MAHEVECTHCHVLMTSWSAAGSPVRYWQCPFCGRTHSSLYSEVFQRGAGARRVEPVKPPGASAPQPSGAAVPQAPGAGVPQASSEEIRWGRLKARAAEWFARLEQEQVVAPASGGGTRRVAAPTGAAATARRTG